MSNLCPSIEYLAKEFNKTQNSKTSIIFAVESERQIQKKIEDMEIEAKNKVDEEQTKFEFNPDEIEPIILNNRNIEER